MKTCISPLATRPILYTDTIKGGQQALRDDLWAVTTEELNELHRAAENAAAVSSILNARIKRLEEQQNGFRPDYLLNGARFKLNFSTRGNVDVFHNYAAELQGRWVALVPAEDDMHLAREVNGNQSGDGALGGKGSDGQLDDNDIDGDAAVPAYYGL
jgi:cell division protein FtsB